MTSELHERVGQHGAEIKALQSDMSEMKGDVKTILAMLNQAKGGWKTLLLVAGVAGAAGALAAKLFPVFFK